MDTTVHALCSPLQKIGQKMYAHTQERHVQYVYTWQGRIIITRYVYTLLLHGLIGILLGAEARRAGLGSLELSQRAPCSGDCHRGCATQCQGW